VPVYRHAVRVPASSVEEARALIAALAPAGWEETEHGEEVSLAVYGEPELAAALEPVFGAVSSQPVAPDWQYRWREFHRPVTVGPWWIGPPWESPPPGLRRVVIDPGQAFGTGAHATTRLCLELLIEQPPTSLLDLGCGSGVLAIAAGTIGFGPIVALDHDQAAVEETERNARANGVPLEARLADVCADPLPIAGLAVANLERALVPVVAGRFSGSRLIASGYPASDGVRLPGWRRAERRQAEGWAADLFERD
jgi:ribosomal protein L11 methyltransferase